MLYYCTHFILFTVVINYIIIQIYSSSMLRACFYILMHLFIFDTTCICYFYYAFIWSIVYLYFLIFITCSMIANYCLIINHIVLYLSCFYVYIFVVLAILLKYMKIIQINHGWQTKLIRSTPINIGAIQINTKISGLFLVENL